MYIEKISIDNFGKLENIIIDCGYSLNVIYALNDSGKTTLLDFIRFIFYGSNIKKGKSDITFKKQYMPWNGNNMSGSIIVCDNDNKYYIHRVEGLKSSSKLLEVKDYKTGESVNHISDLGNFFFGVCEKDFYNTFFVKEILSLDSCDEELSSSIFNFDDNVSYVRTKNILEEKIASINSSKRINSDLKRIDNNLSDIDVSIHNLDKEISLNKEKLLKYNDYENELSVKNKLLDDLKNDKIIINNNELNNRIRYLESLKSQNDFSNYKGTNSLYKKSLKPSFFLALMSFIISVVFLFIKIDMAFMISIILSLALLSFYVLCRIKTHVSTNINTVSDKFICDEINRLKSKIVLSYNTVKKTNIFTNDNIDDIISKTQNEIILIKDSMITLGSCVQNDVELNNKLSYLNNQKAQLIKEREEKLNNLKIYEYALDILKNSFIKLEEDFMPKISRRAFEIFSYVYPDKYTSILCNDRFETKIEHNNLIKDVKTLSTATKDLIYLSMRISLCEFIKNETSPPMFFDDVLSSCDDIKSYKMMDYFYKISSRKQIFVSICKRSELDYYKSKNDVNIIYL